MEVNTASVKIFNKQKVILYGGLLILGAFLYGILTYVITAQQLIELNALSLASEHNNFLWFIRTYGLITIVPLFMLFVYAYIPQKYLLPIFLALGIVLVCRNILTTSVSLPVTIIMGTLLLYFWKAMVLVVFVQLCNQLISFKNSLWFYFLLLCFYNLGSLGFLLFYNDVLHPIPLMIHGFMGVLIVFAYALYQCLLKYGVSSTDRDLFSHLKVSIISKDKKDSVVTQPVFWLLFALIFLQGIFGFFSSNVSKYLIGLQTAGNFEAYNQTMADWATRVGIIQVVVPILFVFICPLLGWVRTIFIPMNMIVFGVGLALFMLSSSINIESTPCLIILFTYVKNILAPILTVLTMSAFILFGPQMRLKGYMFISVIALPGATIFAKLLGENLKMLVGTTDSHTVLWSQVMVISIIAIMMIILVVFLARQVQKRIEVLKI